MKLKARLRLLPVLILVSFLSFAVRVGDFWVGLSQMGQSTAAEQKPVPAEGAEPPPVPASTAKTDAKPADAKTADAQPADAKLTDAKPAASETAPGAAPEDPAEKPGWRDATEEQFSDSTVSAEVMGDLAKRREALDKQARELATREALLTAAQKELDQKLQEMTNLRNEIQGMMKELSDDEKARIQSLVKIYEGMKPGDAARIFNTLDIDVLLEVMSRMSERKSSPVLALMDADRARTITILLAQQKKLPELPPQ